MDRNEAMTLMIKLLKLMILMIVMPRIFLILQTYFECSFSNISHELYPF